MLSTGGFEAFSVNGFDGFFNTVFTSGVSLFGGLPVVPGVIVAVSSRGFAGVFSFGFTRDEGLLPALATGGLATLPVVETAPDFHDGSQQAHIVLAIRHPVRLPIEISSSSRALARRRPIVGQSLGRLQRDER